MFHLDHLVAKTSVAIVAGLASHLDVVSLIASAALIYPAVVAAMSVVTVLVLAIFVMPRFEVFFASLHAKLPLVTRMLLNTTSFMGKWWYGILGHKFLIH